MSEAVALGSVDPAGSRHAGRRSAVAVVDDRVVVGTADGSIRCVDAADGTVRWRWTTDRDPASVVTLIPFAGGVLVGERSVAGEIRLHDAADGRVRWRHRPAVGAPTRESRFFLPFVVAVTAADERAFVAVRRYERDGDARRFESAVLAFGRDGRVRWRRESDASPVALAADGERVAVASNRRPEGSDRPGLVVRDAGSGAERLRWDPPGDGMRRVGDVALEGGDAVVASHADYRGYRLSPAGDVRWRVDLGTETTREGETVYAYPNHVHATASGAVFVTGNTYPEEGREAARRHERATTAFGHAPDGTRRWTAPVGGFAPEVATDGERVAVPVAQAFRVRDADAHGLREFRVREGHRRTTDAAGIVTAATVDGGVTAWVEEPVRYHDGDACGAYRLHVRND
jgi:outer membrane protein assembly factor BamB